MILLTALFLLTVETKADGILCMALSVSSCKHQLQSQQGEDVDSVYTVDVDEFEQMIADTVNVVLLDVRTLEEYQEGHVKGALQIDFKKDSFRDECLKQLPRDKQIALYCRSGFRSKSASKILMNDGFKIINLKGGFNDWKKAEKPVEK